MYHFIKVKRFNEVSCWYFVPKTEEEIIEHLDKYVCPIMKDGIRDTFDTHFKKIMKHPSNQYAVCLELLAMLQNQVNHCNGLLNSTEYKMALALKEWVTSVANGAVRSQTPPIIREQVIKHLNVNVDTEAEYDPYSGRRDPYYTSSAEVSWK